MFALRRVTAFCFFAVVLSCSLFTSAQSLQSRLRGPISDVNRLPLPGSHSPLATTGRDLGAVAPGKQLANIALIFNRSPAQQADLKGLLAAQQDTRSPAYHRWLTPQAFATRFGMQEADLEATRTWLTAHGFVVTAIPPSHDRLVFSGTAAQVQAVFGTSLHTYELHGERHFGPSSDLSLPAALAPITAAVLHLSDLRPRPDSHPLPAFTDAIQGTHFLSPADVAIMYDLHASAADGLDGTGQSLAVVGDSYVSPSIVGLNTFTQAENYAFAPSVVLVPDSGVEATYPGGLGEAQLDLEYASATAPGASLFLVIVGDSPTMGVFDALAYSIQQNIAPVVNISFDLCETLLSSADASSYNELFQQAAAQGQTIVAAAGDSGSTDCVYYPTPFVTTAQQGALAVGFPASNPYVTAVGGTQMSAAALTAGANPFWSPSSTPQYASLLSYVPEVAWNEGLTTQSILATGGGASTLFTRPSWQDSFPAMPPGSTRLLPDIALQASVQSPGFLLCTSDIAYSASPFASSCDNGQLNSSGHYFIGGGTSFSAPIFAGSVALLNQYEQEGGQGSLNATLYNLAANPSTYATAFHDITGGSNACFAGVAGCTPAGQAGFSAGPGYDEATGLGSVDFAQLRAAWPANPQRQPSRQTLVLLCGTAADQGARSFQPGSPAQIDCVLEPLNNSGTPGTGTVSSFLDGVPLASGPTPLNPNFATDFTLSFTAPTTPGSHLLTTVYPGDATHLPITEVYPFTVGAVQASGSLTLSASNLSLSTNAAGVSSVTITPTPGNAYHGVLYWNLSVQQNSGASGSTLCYAINPISVSETTSTNLALGVGTACNSPLPTAARTKRLHSSAAVADLHRQGQQRSLPFYAALLGIGFLGAGRLRRRQSASLGVMTCVGFCLLLPLLGGCGGNTTSGGAGPTPSPQPAQPSSYTVTLYGYDSVNTEGVSAQATFTLTVN